MQKDEGPTHTVNPGVVINHNIAYVYIMVSQWHPKAFGIVNECIDTYLSSSTKSAATKENVLLYDSGTLLPLLLLLDGYACQGHI